jgi:uncharacterized protein
MSHQVDWVIKTSKLCNLRCRYCYEWDDLGDKARMSLALWEKVLVALKAHMAAAVERYRPFAGVRARVILHGGEPMALPLGYLADVIALQNEILPAEWLAKGTVSRALQTNLYRVTDPMLATLREANFGIGVSYDGVPGVRLSASGEETEARVLENLERLEAWGFPLGIITVLAGHTAPHITEIYDSFRDRVRRLRFLPLFNGPDSRPLDLVDAEPALLVEALCRLFVHWFEHSCQPEVAPLNGYFRSVILKMLGLAQLPYERRHHGDHVFVVDLDGKLYAPNAGYSGAFGSLMENSIEEILDSPPYLATLDDDDAARGMICGSCDYHGGCNSYPLLSNPDGGIAQGRCLIAKPVCEFIEAFLRREGFDEAALREMFDDVGGGFQASAADPLPL